MKKTAVIEIIFYGAKFEVNQISHYLSLAKLLLDTNAQIQQN